MENIRLLKTQFKIQIKMIHFENMSIDKSD